MTAATSTWGDWRSRATLWRVALVSEPVRMTTRRREAVISVIASLGDPSENLSPERQTRGILRQAGVHIGVRRAHRVEAERCDRSGPCLSAVLDPSHGILEILADGFGKHAGRAGRDEPAGLPIDDELGVPADAGCDDR